MPTLKAEPVLSSSNDERFPPENAFDNDGKKFFVTTGMYPQEITVAFSGEYPNGVNLSRILFICTGISKLKVSKCTEHHAGHFEPIVDCDISAPNREGDLQREQFKVGSSAGSGIRFVKLSIEAGYAPFVTLRSVVFEGEPTTS